MCVALSSEFLFASTNIYQQIKNMIMLKAFLSSLGQTSENPQSTVSKCCPLMNEINE